MPKKILILLILIIVGFGLGVFIDVEAWTCGDLVTFTYKGSEVTYGSVFNPATGQCWLDRNLGATQVATAYNDSAAYGDLFQWGRCDDGHQSRTSGITTILSSTDVPGHGNFIYDIAAPPRDWRSPQNDNLWQGVSGINNPCPSGWRIPTREEWEAEYLSWSSQNYNGAFASPLKLTAGGLRYYVDASLSDVNASGRYWSSTEVTGFSYILLFDSTNIQLGGSVRADGYSVRCIYDTPLPAETCNYHNVWGWAWANMESPSHDPTIGWISFSCRNCDTDGDGTIDHPQCPTGSTADYGVDIDSVTGQFSGHAWSGGGVDAAGNEVPVLGWLSFNITETGPPPGDPVFGTHLAQVSTTTGDVSGWARFLAACDSVPCTSSGPCANCGGWDGWIKLGNLPHQPWHAGVGQQVYIDFGAGPPSDFHGWAWGDDVVGWLSFNCANEGCGPSDYKVMTGLSFAPPPSLPYIESATSTDEYCNIFAGVGRVDFGWTYKHDDGYNQASYHLQVATDSTFGTILVDYQPSDPQIVSPNGKGSSAILIVEDPGTNPNCGVGDSFEDRCVAYGPPYSWRVKVKDENDNWSADWGPDPPASFATPAHAYPWVDFSWFPDRPNINQEVQFTDNSTPFGGASMAGRTWQFQDGSPANLTGPNPTTTFTAIAPSPGNRVDLYACDNTPLAQGGPYCCPKDDYIKVTFPLPEYREVRPRSQLDNFLARIVGIFR